MKWVKLLLLLLFTITVTTIIIIITTVIAIIIYTNHTYMYAHTFHSSFLYIQIYPLTHTDTKLIYKNEY